MSPFRAPMRLQAASQHLSTGAWEYILLFPFLASQQILEAAVSVTTSVCDCSQPLSMGSCRGIHGFWSSTMAVVFFTFLASVVSTSGPVNASNS